MSQDHAAAVLGQHFGPFVRWRPTQKLLPSHPMSFEPDHPVTVFYLATEPFRGGHRWLVRQYGVIQSVETGNEAFASEAEARKSGRRALIRTSAHKPLGLRGADFDATIDGQPVG